MTTTQAAVVESGGAPFSFSNVELADPHPDEVVVRMVAAGLCHTDLGVASGGLPFPLPGILGHEGAGIVEEVGSAVTRVAPRAAAKLVDHDGGQGFGRGLAFRRGSW